MMYLTQLQLHLYIRVFVENFTFWKLEMEIVIQGYDHEINNEFV